MSFVQEVADAIKQYLVPQTPIGNKDIIWMYNGSLSYIKDEYQKQLLIG